MVAKSKIFNLVLEEYDKLNDKHVSNVDIYNYLSDNDTNIEFFAFVLHDKDTNNEGVIERKHYHLFIKLVNSISKNTILKDIAKNLMVNVNCISVEVSRNIVSSIQYLIHRNDKTKFQYDILDIWSNDYADLVSILNNGVSSYSLDIDYLINLIHESKSLTSVYRKLGMSQVRIYRPIINDLWKEKKFYE